MERAKIWHEDDLFWETFGSYMFTQRRLANAPTEVERIVSLTDIKPRAYVLDLGCGVGRHSLEFARRRFQITGVDRTEQYLKQASEWAKEEGLKVEFVQEDMRTFCRSDTFDAVISMFTSFGFFKDPEENRQVILNVYHSLKAGGVFLLETAGKETFARIFQEKSWNEHDGMLILSKRKVSQNWSWMENHQIVIRGDSHIEFDMNHRLYSATELIALLTSCGFSQATAYGDLEGSPYDHTAERLVVVGRK